MATDTTDDLVAGIARWAECESPTKDAQAVERMLDIVEAEFAGAPFGIERIPGKDGFEVCRRINADPQTMAIHVIAMTAHHTAETEQTILEAGAAACFAKPVDIERLAAQIESLLARSA